MGYLEQLENTGFGNGDSENNKKREGEWDGIPFENWFGLHTEILNWVIWFGSEIKTGKQNLRDDWLGIWFQMDKNNINTRNQNWKWMLRFGSMDWVWDLRLLAFYSWLFLLLFWGKRGQVSRLGRRRRRSVSLKTWKRKEKWLVLEDLDSLKGSLVSRIW